jgi:aryl-alcohol dehydrogenase-like predicted oxidoreductase
MRTDAEVLRALSRPLIGLGCATFGGTISVPESVHVIAAAVEGGVRHLDVARSYGYGEAETAVGRFLRTTDASDVTVTTKVGIRPPGGLRKVKALRAIARRAADLSPALKRRIVRAASSGVASSRFGLDDLTDSLASSLRALQVDRVDALLLHECAPDDVTDDVLGWLHEHVALGDIGTWGIATGVEQAVAIGARTAVPLVQVPAPLTSALPGELVQREGALVRHSVLRPTLAPLARLLEQQPGRRVREEDRLGLSLRPDDLALVALRLALAESPGGAVLVGTRRAEHARALGGVEPLRPESVPLVRALLHEADAGTSAVR